MNYFYLYHFMLLSRFLHESLLGKCTTIFEMVSMSVAYGNKVIIHNYNINSTSRLIVPRCLQFCRKGLLSQRWAVQFCYSRLRMHLRIFYLVHPEHNN
jgi:hypothetical protein